ncbi:DUF58 domain-containing protein [Pseudokineococcus basanitobsidens]|uniref:DUF58 domain-containing protein n=1 Tax=Pseudokineococcus basanitobsidens TaxID=1926649 RepID=A0ABU8RHK5_9ACTN
MRSGRGVRARAVSAWRRGAGALTARGRALAVLGVAAVVVGVVLSHRDLLRLGLLLVALPLGGWVVARVPRPSLVVERTVSPEVVAVGDPVSVRLDLHGRGRGRGALLAEDLVPPALRAAPRFVVDRLPAGTSASVRYALRADVRGVHRVGPLRLVSRDPLGLVELPVSTRATDPLVVVPATVHLPPLRLHGGAGGATASDPGTGEDDVVPREYRAGDDRRRVHWRTSARQGELMVRRDERPRRASASVLLDLGAGEVSGPDDGAGHDAFELAVTAAASAAERLALDDVAVRLLTGSPADAGREGGRGRGARLERLAAVAPTTAEPSEPAGDRGGGAGALDAALRRLGGRREDAVVAVVGPRAVPALLAATSGRRAARSVALVVGREDGDDDAEVGAALSALAGAGWGAAGLRVGGAGDDAPDHAPHHALDRAPDRAPDRGRDGDTDGGAQAALGAAWSRAVRAAAPSRRAPSPSAPAAAGRAGAHPGPQPGAQAPAGSPA